ncbi:MAG: hypothetical protein A2Y41_05245 [Spirochaetes bacterium GWB1_36_13]|nr:MAG: hypothetical protein A2Y41_05245 [Spirochaetes bacterium GWB1_36_13]
MQNCHFRFCLQKKLKHLLSIDSRLRGNDRKGSFFCNLKSFQYISIEYSFLIQKCFTLFKKKVFFYYFL